MPFENRLREYRIRRGLTLRELGDAVKMNYSHLSKIENGEKRISDIRKIRLAKFFDVSVQDLFFAESVENQDTDHTVEAVA